MNTMSLPRASAVLPLLFLLSAPACRAVPVTVDPEALALLQKVQTTSQKMHSLTADFEADTHTTLKTNYRFQGVLKLMKPNYLHEQAVLLRRDEVSDAWKTQDVALIKASDGKSLWWVPSGMSAQRNEADPQGHDITLPVMPTGDFFDSSKSILSQVKQQQAKGELLSLTCAGTRVWESRFYRLIDWDYEPEHLSEAIRKGAPSGIVTEREQLYIGSDNLVYRVVETYNIGLSGERMLRNVKVNAPLTAASFEFTLPPGAHLPPPPPPLLADGTPAPDFAAIAPDGSTVHLSDYKGKTVVLDFWSTWCGPCQMSMPHLEKVYQQVKDKNVAVLGVCVWDEKPAYDKWIVDKKGTYDFPTAFDPAGRGANSIASSLYHVSGIPTQYVIDKDGNIAASTVGYDEGGTLLETALNKLGTDIPIPAAHK